MTRENTRRKILEAALSLFSEKGYLGTTTKGIAERASVSEVTLFRHFRSKEELFEEVLSRYSFLPKLRRILDRVEHLPPEEALFTIGREFLRNLRKKKELVRIILSEGPHFSEKVKNAHEKISRELITLIENYLSSLPGLSSRREEEIEVLANMFLRNVFAFYFTEEILRNRRVSRRETETYLRLLVSTFIYGITRAPLEDGGRH